MCLNKVSLCSMNSVMILAWLCRCSMTWEMFKANGSRRNSMRIFLLHRPSWVWACAAQDYSRDNYRQFTEVVRKLPNREPLERWLERTDLIESCRRRAVEHMNATFEALADKLDEENISWSREVFRELRGVGNGIAEAYA